MIHFKAGVISNSIHPASTTVTRFHTRAFVCRKFWGNLELADLDVLEGHVTILDILIFIIFYQNKLKIQIYLLTLRFLNYIHKVYFSYYLQHSRFFRNNYLFQILIIIVNFNFYKSFCMSKDFKFRSGFTVGGELFKRASCIIASYSLQSRQGKRTRLCVLLLYLSLT